MKIFCFPDPIYLQVEVAENKKLRPSLRTVKSGGSGGGIFMNLRVPLGF